MFRRIVLAVYAIVIAAMAMATVFEKVCGTDWASHYVYTSSWFIVLWALLASAGAVYIISRKVRRASVLTLHVAFVVMLCGGLLTHLTARQYTLHLREDVADNSLPFTVSLQKFSLEYHAGTQAPRDYVSFITISDEGKRIKGCVSVNNVFEYRGYRFYQKSYDADLEGTTLEVKVDPWGIGTSYVGYALLFVSLIWMLFDPRGNFRRTLSKTSATALVVLLLGFSTSAGATTTISKQEALRLSEQCINYSDRICPVETYALDFTQAICGARSYKGCNATQVLAGFVLYPDEWAKEPVIRIKSRAIRDMYGLREQASLSDFFDKRRGGYLLTEQVEEYYEGQTDKLHRDVAALDDKIAMIIKARSGFDFARPEHYPSAFRLWCEHAYNALPYTTILFIVCLTMGFASLLPWRLVRSKAISAVCLAGVTAVLGLRWAVSGTVPMANGYETMLLMAWLVLVVALVLSRRFAILNTLGLLLAGFFLLVSHIGTFSPQISHVMPVLQSPLLSLHVSVIMMAYALLSITAVCGAVALAVPKQAEALADLSVVMLYPAVACLGIGIFVGAIWANISWGTYWQWDPKETWALITMMIYAIPLHKASLPQLGCHRTFHVFMLCAFASVVITYLGVNYILGGMHSYA